MHSHLQHLQLSRGLDGDGTIGLTLAVEGLGLHLLNDLLAAGDLTEDNVLAVKVRSGDKGDEELRAVGVLTSIGHAQQVRLGVLVVEVLVLKLLTVDGLATSALSLKVSTRADE